MQLWSLNTFFFFWGREALGGVCVSGGGGGGEGRAPATCDIGMEEKTEALKPVT